MSRKTDAQDVLRAGTELLERIDLTVRETRQMTTKARVDRLLESAAPAIGMTYWAQDRKTYLSEVQKGAPPDPVWEELFEANVYHRAHPDGLTDVHYREDVVGLCEMTPSYENPHDRDVLDDPELAVGPVSVARTSVIEEYMLAQADAVVRTGIDVHVPFGDQMRVYTYACTVTFDVDEHGIVRGRVAT